MASKGQLFRTFLLGVLFAIFLISPQRYLEDLIGTWSMAYLNIEGTLKLY